MTNEQLCAFAKDGDSKAQEQLCQNIFPNIQQTAYKIAKVFSSLKIEIDDLIQEGSLGYLRAVKNYQPDHNILFWSYAQSAVENAMMDYIRSFRAEYEALGKPHPFYQEDNENCDNNNDFIEQIPNQQFKTPEQICIEVESLEEIYHALAVIAPREKTYLYYRYGLECYDEHDRSKAAKHFHLSISRAKKLECLALDNFRLELPWWY